MLSDWFVTQWAVQCIDTLTTDLTAAHNKLPFGCWYMLELPLAAYKTHRRPSYLGGIEGTAGQPVCAMFGPSGTSAASASSSAWAKPWRS